MGLNESREEYLEKLIINTKNTIWYHGSEHTISKEDLDPLFRLRDVYKNDKDKKMWGRTGSSEDSCGIFFGKDPKDRSMTGALSYSKFDHTSAPYTHGFMYEMKLNSDCKVKDDSALHRIGFEQYKKYISEGVDVLTNGSEINVLNPNSIEYFKKIDEWKIFPTLYNYVRGKKVGDPIYFGNEQEMKEFLNNELGEYKVLNPFNKTLYVPVDESNNKAYELFHERKWINGLI